MPGQTDLLDELVVVAGRDVLDIGCGDGWLTRRLAARGARAVGIEPAADALKAAEAATPGGEVRFRRGSAEQLPMPDASFDVAIFFNSLHHVPEEQMGAALGEAVRVCRSSGLIYIQEPMAEGPFFALMLAVDDETAVREAARRAIRHAGAQPGLTMSERTFTPVIRVAGYDAWREHQILVDPRRAGPLAAHEATLRERFRQLGTEDGDGWSFAAPAHITLMHLANP